MDALRAYGVILWLKFEDTPFWGRLAGAVVGVGNLIWGDMLTGIILVASIASLVDWHYGRAVARKRQVFNQQIALYGWQVKAGAILVIFIVRGFEWWVSDLPEPFGLNTRGAASALLAVGLLADELESIDRNLRALGGRGLPLLSPVLAWMRRHAEKLRPGKST